MSDGPWLVIPNWARFQHYRDRNPSWVKVYTELNRRDDWRELTHAERGLLVGLWLEYAAAGGVLRVKNLGARLGQRVSSRSLERLSEAGFVEVSASKPLALRALAREEKRKKGLAKTGSPETLSFPEYLATLKGGDR